MQFETYVSNKITAARNIRTATLLQMTDRSLGSQFFIKKGVEEVQELQDELNTPRGSIDHVRILDEANDVLVFAQTALEAHGINIDDRISGLPDEIKLNVGSDVLERIAETLQEIIERPEAFTVLLQQILALSKAYPVKGTNVLDMMKKTVEKVMANRPPELYTTYYSRERRELNEEEQMQKYFYLETATRLIRNRCGNRMSRCHWEPITSFFDDWENAQRNLNNLKTALEMMPIDIFTKGGWYAGNEFVWKTLNGAITHEKGILRYQQ